MAKEDLQALMVAAQLRYNCEEVLLGYSFLNVQNDRYIELFSNCNIHLLNNVDQINRQFWWPELIPFDVC